MKRFIFISAFLAFIFSTGIGSSLEVIKNADTFYPWSVSKDYPPITGEKPKDGNKVDLRSSPFISIIWMIDTYKLTSSDTASCTFSPTCSIYTREAISKHGIFLGLIMGAERIMRFHHDAGGYSLIDDKEFYRLYDPVELNDFWFR